MDSGHNIKHSHFLASCIVFCVHLPTLYLYLLLFSSAMLLGMSGYSTLELAHMHSLPPLTVVLLHLSNYWRCFLHGNGGPTSVSPIGSCVHIIAGESI